MFLFSIKKQLEFACNNCSDIAPLLHPIKRLFLKFSTNDLVDYLRNNPNICKKILVEAGDKRWSPSTFIVPKNSHYLVGIYDQGHTKTQQLASIEEAVADYILLNWKMPRLRPMEHHHKMS